MPGRNTTNAKQVNGLPTTTTATATAVTGGTGITVANSVVSIDGAVVATDADVANYKAAYELPAVHTVALNSQVAEVKYSPSISAVGFGFAPAAFVYEKFSGGKYRVTLQGMVQRTLGNVATAFGVAQPLFTMPGGAGVYPNLRPQSGTLVFRCAAQYSAVGGAPGLNRTTRIDISTNGIVTANAGGAGDQADMCNLDGITYWAIPV
jgi:hypothetical protein